MHIRDIFWALKIPQPFQSTFIFVQGIKRHLVHERGQLSENAYVSTAGGGEGQIVEPPEEKPEGKKTKGYINSWLDVQRFMPVTLISE